MKVLVSVASKHGATAEIADHVGEVLHRRGFETTVLHPEEVGSVENYDAVVLGSAVYAGHWLKEAKDLAAGIAVSHPLPLVWLMSSGPVGVPLKPDEDPVDVADLVEATRALEHAVFAGKIDKSKLSFGERAIAGALRVPEGDYRDWDSITIWASAIADILDDEIPSLLDP